jgi:hypothetical protein
MNCLSSSSLFMGFYMGRGAKALLAWRALGRDEDLEQGFDLLQAW